MSFASLSPMAHFCVSQIRSFIGSIDEKLLTSSAKRLGLAERLWFNFFILQKIEGDYNDQCI
ncbi:hypothetical protein BZG83_15780 [Salinivibrio sp. PR919]|nr:hypothetical protein BZG83_15780 [Salinivibrio sp. PR919]OOF17621.1 hypothetical protein BZG84_06505 [Salinivibrio sp. PR932]